jgi:hypothetical protein
MTDHPPKGQRALCQEIRQVLNDSKSLLRWVSRKFTLPAARGSRTRLLCKYRAKPVRRAAELCYFGATPRLRSACVVPIAIR